MLDQENTFDDKAEHLTTANSTNVINTQSALSDLGAGNPIYIVAAVTTAMTDGSSNYTMSLALHTDDNAALSSSVNLLEIGTFPATSAVGTQFAVALPVTDTYQKYIGVKYTVANGDLTTGNFDVYLTTQVDSSRSYPDAL